MPDLPAGYHFQINAWATERDFTKGNDNGRFRVFMVSSDRDLDDAFAAIRALFDKMPKVQTPSF